MSASYYPPGGSPEELRETIAQMMAVLEIRAEIVGRSAQIGDDALLAYGLRVITAELKAALAAAGMLAEITAPERERRRAARLPNHDVQEASV